MSWASLTMHKPQRFLECSILGGEFLWAPPFSTTTHPQRFGWTSTSCGFTKHSKLSTEVGVWRGVKPKVIHPKKVGGYGEAGTNWEIHPRSLDLFLHVVFVVSSVLKSSLIARTFLEDFRGKKWLSLALKWFPRLSLALVLLDASSRKNEPPKGCIKKFMEPLYIQ